jgi:SAM-dependent methyltransferase
MPPAPEPWPPIVGANFDDADVVRCYAHRPPYPPALYDRLLALSPGRRLAIDLGCGPGKISGVLARSFDEVVAVDPSRPMLAAAQATHTARNIRWILGVAETAPLPGPADLVTAGASIHWMDHASVFPRLADVLAPGAVVAVIDGDGAFEPPWREAWFDTMTDWVARFGARYYPTAFDKKGQAYQAWFDVGAEEHFIFEHRQSVESLIACEHSRATWTRARMGAPLAGAFDEDLRRILAPHVRQGLLTYQVRTRLVWGRPRASPATSAGQIGPAGV